MRKSSTAQRASGAQNAIVAVEASIPCECLHKKTNSTGLIRSTDAVARFQSSLRFYSIPLWRLLFFDGRARTNINRPFRYANWLTGPSFVGFIALTSVSATPSSWLSSVKERLDSFHCESLHECSCCTEGARLKVPWTENVISDRKNLSRTVCSLGFFSKVVHANVCKFCCLCKVGDPLATSRFAPMAAYLAIFRPCVRGGLASVSVFPGLKCRLILYCLGVNIGNWYNNTPQHRSQTQHWSLLESDVYQSNHATPTAQQRHGG